MRPRSKADSYPGVVSGHSRRPAWLRVKVQDSDTYQNLNRLLAGLQLHTVCEEARCPNIWECWGKHRTATFLLLGDTCTRGCGYCSVRRGQPSQPDGQEPAKVAAAVRDLGLEHAVITSVTRDDLEDGGASHFAATIAAVRATCPLASIEVLIPDFAGQAEALSRVLHARPDVLNHNVETVPRLFHELRPQGDFQRSCDLLARTDAFRRSHGSRLVTKSGLMLGLGESWDEVLAVMDALRSAGCDILTMGQYLNPTRHHAPPRRFYTPAEFEELKQEGDRRGFLHVESGPLVRSSYHAVVGASRAACRSAP